MALPGEARWQDELAPLRAQVLRQLGDREGALVTAITRSLRTEVAGYGEGDRQVLPPEEVEAAGRRHVRIALSGIDARGRLAASTRGRLEQLARERAGQGVPLHALVQACQIGARELWRALLEVVPEVAPDAATRAELLEELSSASLQLTSEISATVTAAYVETGRHRLIDRERTRHELLQQLLSGAAPAPAALRRRVEAVGFRLGAAHVVALVAPTGPGADDALHARIRDALQGALAPSAAPLLGTQGETKVAVYPVPLDLPEHELRRAIEDRLGRAGLDDVGYHAAIGRVEPGVEGVAVSYRQAETTVQLARDCGVVGRTLSYVHSLPFLLLTANPEVAHDLQRATIEPLRAHDRDRGTDLVETCAALLEAQGNRAEAAKRLHVHRHTLATRLRRIEELTGRSFDDRDDVLLLELGVRADDLLDDADERDSSD